MVNLEILAYLLSGKAVIGQVCYLANVQLRGTCLAEGAAQQKGHVQHQGFFLNQLGEGSCLAEGAAQKGHVQHQGFFLNQLGEGSC